ncbi:MAG: GntR family transcriptional regulator [Paracoccaceae bacterium]|nr:GntR family transcriptional regulator [Paracoccaceae bacterium]
MRIELQPVSANFTLKDHIFEVLREAILDMNIYADDAELRLDERKLADQLGISRTPVREALARLEQDGFVDIQPRKGVFIRRKSLEEVLEMVVVWAALESMAIRLATERASESEIRTIRTLASGFSESSASVDVGEYSEANIRFHQGILRLSGCKLLIELSEGLFMQMRAVRRRAMAENDRAVRSVVDHMVIVEALESRDADLASRLVREHTMGLHDHIRRTWTADDGADVADKGCIEDRPAGMRDGIAGRV